MPPELCFLLGGRPDVVLRHLTPDNPVLELLTGNMRGATKKELEDALRRANDYYLHRKRVQYRRQWLSRSPAKLARNPESA